MSTAGAQPCNACSAVWTGSKMIAWGPSGDSSLGLGQVYDPATDSWTFTTTDGAPTARSGHTTVWTGSRMIVWGGRDDEDLYAPLTSTGGTYDPGTDTWTPTSLVGAPSRREDHTAVWTGSKMIVWGGSEGCSWGYTFATDTGVIYDPAKDSWSPMSAIGAPSARKGHTAVWTGSKMIVWGGAQGAYGEPAETGAIYDPATDTWTPMSTTGAPAGRDGHTAVWTGSKMVVWGGREGGGSGARDTRVSHDLATGTGAIYDPKTDTWRPTSSAGAPRARQAHTAVWTGSKMIVWGGYDDVVGHLDTGGAYSQAGSIPSDFNGDGKRDLLFRHPLTGDIAAQYMDGVKKVGGAALSAKPGSLAWVPVGVADFNADGKPDILFHNQTTGGLVVWYMDGVKKVGGAALSAKPGSLSWVPVGVADFNADGKPDILFRYQPGGDLAVWYLNGVTKTGGVTLSAKPGSLSWLPVGVADFNADGKPDILFRNQPTGQHVVWHLDGVTKMGVAALSPAGPANRGWEAVALADYNGDGKADIVWRYAPTGDLFVWFMDGVTKTGGGPTSPAKAALPWQVVAPR